MTMAKFKKPTAKARKGAPPKLEEASTNLSKQPSSASVNMNFKVPAEFAKEFKQVALDHDMKLVELLRASFEEYKK